ncbi:MULTISPECIES: ATP-binding protein [unclassified Streptomyces]|uniref:ATP-binding protein n=1 Tax=unclassified Streptomyces TaxID=2593676 RepID=UPI00227041BE|nr:MULTISPECIES: ATP-binding protein [unclassified Streptomyces]MCY0918519.1 ATP-binding protein [Streptomyces sp. H27-G5]MCY0960058.1 ATP-binding protein [Streptomyces sp. H27-H5]
MNDIQATDTSVPADLVIEDDCAAGIARARDVARVYAASLDPAAPADTSDALQLVVSELTTNALRHGGGHYTLHLSSGPDSVSVAVSDNSSVLPQERTPDLAGRAGGFGWHMVRHYCRSLAVTLVPGEGKTILAVLPL